MPATTTQVNGCDAVIFIDDSVGTPQDVSGSANEFELDFNVVIGQFKVFNQPWAKRISCGREASLSLTIIYTMAANEGMDILKDWFWNSHTVPRTVTIQMPDGSVGSDQYDGEYLIESFNIQGSAEDAGPTMVSMELVPDGAVDWTTI